MSQSENSSNVQTEKYQPFSSLYPSDLWKGFLKFWWICIIFSVIFAGYSFYNSYILFKPEYSASSTFTVTTQSNSIADGGFTSYSFYFDSTAATQLSDTFPHILSSNLLQDAICEDLQIGSVPVHLDASSVIDTNMFTITARGSDPQMVYDVLVSAIKNYPSIARYIIGNVELVSITEPYVPQKPDNESKYKSDTLTGAALGLLPGLLWILLYAIIRKTVRTKEDIKRDLKTDVVGILPQVTFKKYKTEIDTSILLTNPRIGSGFKESLRVLRNTFVNSLDKNDKVIMVTSTSPGEGKTTAITNLAISLSDLGKKVLLVDCDLRNPSVAPLLGLEHEEEKRGKKSNVYKIKYLRKYKISVMSFIEEDERYWNIMRMNLIETIINSVKDDYDYILIDTPPCGLVSDALVVAQIADCAIYVILQDTIRVSRILDGIDSLIATDVNFKGCILNGAKSGISGYGENYGYGYGYGYSRYGYGRYGYGYGYGYGESDKKKK